MYNSQEIRWFTQTEDKQITNWFEKMGWTFARTESRTDYYLPLKQDDLSIKLREGNIEIKQRKGQPKKGTLTPLSEGSFEDWVKWSFSLCKADKLSLEVITDHKKYDWLETIKTRIGVKIAPDITGYKIIPINERIPYGCQIEYTKVILKRKTHFTFALEWFGEQYIELDNALLDEVLGNTVFKIGDSMGYGEFLKKNS